jgi:hypothetical protein
VKRLLVVFVFLIAACGKRGDPRPPVPIIPQATSDLVVAQRADRIFLTWSYPALTTTGRSFSDLRRIVVYRYSEPLPPSTSTAPDAPRESAVADPVAQFARVPELTPVQFGRLSQRIKSIEGAELTDATVGDHLIFEDTPSMRTMSGQPVRLTYGVVTEGLNARSELSNLVTIIPLVVAVPPASLSATAQADGVRLAWPAPERSIAGGVAPVIIGYNVYRGTAREFEKPINQTLVSSTTYTDVPPYGEHQYRVTAVAAVGPPAIESSPSPVASATFKDLVAPPPPASVSALVETTAVRLVWDAVEASDLAGYKIYRIEGTGMTELREVGRILFTKEPIRETNFRDIAIQPGISYKYEVTAIDTSGNESAPATTGWALVPRTP